MTNPQAPIPTFQLQAKLFRGFSDRSRLAILEVLRNGALPVGEIAKATGLTQPNVSNHLKCLSECGLVVAEQKGRFVHYGLGDEGVARMLRLADELLAGSGGQRILTCSNYREVGCGSERPDDERAASGPSARDRRTASFGEMSS
jgi:DNA-binding transcriptional ArsR family regulator